MQELFQQILLVRLKDGGHVRTPRVEAALRAVPRHLFLPAVPLSEVYSDQAIIAQRQNGVPASSASYPSVVAAMLEQLDPLAGQRVLEIGAGTGYNAALLAHLVGQAGRVVTMEFDPQVAAGARLHLAAAGCERVEVVCGDGGRGYPAAAPYDRIVATVGVWDLPPAWQEQLAEQGRLLAPLWLRGEQRTVAFERAAGCLESVSVAAWGFVPPRGELAGDAAVLPLGSGDGLWLAAEGLGPGDAGRVHRLLSGPRRDTAVGLRVTAGEALEGLGFWLALHEPGFVRLTAEGETTRGRDLVPLLLHSLTGCIRTTCGLLEGSTLCALVRSPEQPPPPGPVGDEAPFDLSVRTFGPGDGLPRRLVERLEAWDGTCRPATRGLRVRAYPAGSFVPVAGEIVLRRRWTDLVFDWP